jgi:hypothetical protein
MESLDFIVSIGSVLFVMAIIGIIVVSATTVYMKYSK